MRAGYESRFLRAVDPGAPRGAWIRHTTFRRAGGPPARSLWCTVWDAAAGPPVTAKVTPPRDAAGVFAATTDGGLHATGAVPGRARWDVRVRPAAEPLRHLPHPLFYRAPLPRTKLTSPAPAALLTGTVAAGGRTLALAGWPGMAGHNWGAGHAETWVWLHCATFAEDPGAWLDLAIGRLRLAGRLTPWMAAGALHARGVRHALGGPGVAVAVDARPGAARVELPGVTLEATAPAGQTVAWVYADPPGGEHHALNCSIAALRLEHAGGTLSTPHGGAYELGLRGHDHGIALAPFPDP